MYKAQHTETSISDDLVSIITLLSVLGLHLSIPTDADSVLDILCGLERLEGLDKLHNTDNILVTFKIIFELMTNVSFQPKKRDPPQEPLAGTFGGSQCFLTI